MKKEQDNNNKRKSFFSNFIKENKNKKNSFFKNFNDHDLNKTPIFSIFIILIFVVNFIILIVLGLQANQEGNFLDGVLGYGANNRYFVFEKLQIYRLIIFPFVESFNLTNFDLWSIFWSFITLFFILRTFWIVGYYLNVIVGSKKTAIIWITAIILIGFGQIALTSNPKVFYYGTEYLTLISLGALLGSFITLGSKDKQLKEVIKNVFLRISFFVFIFAIFKYQKLTEFDNIYPSSQYLEYGSYIFVFYVLSFLCGFLLFIITNYKKSMNNIENIALYISIISLATFFIASLVFAVINNYFEKIILQDETKEWFERFPKLKINNLLGWN